VVIWRHRISLVVLAVLTALPVSGAVCAMRCDSAAASVGVAHHRSAANCEETGAPSSGPLLRGTPGHNCGEHDVRTRQTVTTTATRADGIAAPALVATAPVFKAVGGHETFDAPTDYRSPPDSTPRTASPLVLRV
jgi:hypothetical protein